FLRNATRDSSRCAHLGKIARASKQAISNARRPSTTACDLFRSTFVHFNGQNFRGSMKDDQQIFGLIKIEPMNDAKTRTQRRGNQPGTRRRANEGEMIQMKRMNASAGSLADDEIHTEILHRWIKDLFHSRLEPMDLIEKENFAAFERSENCREVAFAL